MYFRIGYFVFHNIFIILCFIFRINFGRRLKITINVFYRLDVVLLIIFAILSYMNMTFILLALKYPNNSPTLTIIILFLFYFLNLILLMWVSNDYFEFKEVYFIHQNFLFIKHKYYYSKIDDSYHYLLGRQRFIKICFGNKKISIRTNDKVDDVFIQKKIKIRKSRFAISER